jgi:hypothetical protein
MRRKPLHMLETFWNTCCNANRALYLAGVLSGGGLVYHLFVIALAHQFGVDAARVAVGEGDWSFGQTLAMLMVVQPLVEMCMECKKWYPNRKRLDNQ